MKKAVLITFMLLCSLFFFGQNQALGVPVTFDFTATGTLTGTNMGDSDWGEVAGYSYLWDPATSSYVEVWDDSEEISAGDDSTSVAMSYSWTMDLPICQPFDFWLSLEGIGYTHNTEEAEISWNVTGHLTITGPLEWPYIEYGAAAAIDADDSWDWDEMWDPSHAVASVTWDPSGEASGEAQVGDLLTIQGNVTLASGATWTDGWSGAAIEGQFHPVPEPGTILLVGSGLAGLAAIRRRKKSR